MARSRQVDSEADDPIECLDVFCLVVLILCGCGLAIACCLCAALGDPTILFGGLDFHGRVCGVHKDLIKQPFLYWPLPDELGSGRCVQSCPDSEDFLSGATVQLPRAEPLVLQERSDGNHVAFSQSVWLMEVPVYPTQPAVGRFCIPAPETRLVSPKFVLGNMSLAPTSDNSRPGRLARNAMLPSLKASLGRLEPQLYRTIAQIERLKYRLVICMFIVPLITGALPVLLVRYCAGFVLWLLVVICGVGTFSLGVLVFATEYFLRGIDDFAIPILNELELTLARVFSWSLVLCSLVILVGALFSRNLLRWAAVCVEVTALQIQDRGLAIPIAIVVALAAVGQSIASLLILWLLRGWSSVGMMHWPATYPSAIQSPEVGMKFPSDLEAEVVPGGPLVRSLHREFEFLCHPLFVIFVSLVILRTFHALIAAMGRFIIAEMLLHCFFIQSKPPSAFAALNASFCNLLAGRMGTVASAAFRPRLLPSMICRLLANFVPRCCIPVCCVSSAEAFGAAPFAHVSWHAEKFNTSARQVTIAFSRAPFSVQCLAGLPVLFEAAVACFASLVSVSFLLVSLLQQEHGYALNYVETGIGVGILCAFVSSPLAATWASTYTAAFDVFLYCIIEVATDCDLRSALFLHEHTPTHFRSLLAEALEKFRDSPRALSKQRTLLEAPYDYAAVADSSGSDDDGQ